MLPETRVIEHKLVILVIGENLSEVYSEFIDFFIVMMQFTLNFSSLIQVEAVLYNVKELFPIVVHSIVMVCVSLPRLVGFAHMCAYRLSLWLVIDLITDILKYLYGKRNF